MSHAQITFLVEGILILAAIALGALVGRKGKPYGKVTLTVHVFFFVWFTVGFGFIFAELVTRGTRFVTWFPVSLMGLAILIQLATGVAMIVRKKAGGGLPQAHLTSAAVLFLSDVAAFLVTGNPA